MRFMSELTAAEWLDTSRHVSIAFTLALLGWSLLCWWRPRPPARRHAARQLRVVRGNRPPPVGR
jgi:hypothetical protein